ncbi:sensor histidine kinase [Ahniella affigens]|uniref:sensor histidine kinase n=1 Tax=Ahniella affigens TaxID=2021234 RepID=UPI0014758643|nr:histidine kinase [Ahniella affigens]
MRADIGWPQVWLKRGLLACYWLSASLFALVWFRDRVVGVSRFRSHAIGALWIAMLMTVLGVLYISIVVVAISHGKIGFFRALQQQWGFELLYTWFNGIQIVAAANAFHYFLYTRRQEQAKALLQLKLSEAEISLLRAQLEPHFLFNTLNSIASLARLNRVQATVDALNQLGGLLRGVLEVGRRQLMPWPWELEFTRLYVALQTLRFADKLDVRLHVGPIPEGTPFPVMLLQPLIENAIHHGPLADGERCVVDVSVILDQRYWQVEVSNRIGHTAAHGSHGVGWSNSKARLRAIYGDRASFAQARSAAFFTVSARFPEQVEHEGVGA